MECVELLPPLKTTAQIAQRFNLKPETLANWRCGRKGPPFVKMEGGTVRYDESAVVAWLQKQTVVTQG
jgi:hypothetical protein